MACLRRVLPVCLLLGLLGVFAPASAETYQRVIALGGDMTEIVYALGQDDRLVATDTTSVYPAGARQTPKVGYVRQLNAEGVLSLNPDLILISGAAGPPAAIEQLRASGVEIVAIEEEYSIAAIREKIRRIAAVLGVETRGAELIAQVDRDWQRTRDIVAQMAQSPRLLFFFSVGDGAPRAAGMGTAADAVIRLAGGRNVFADRAGIKAFSFEAAAQADPDIILYMRRHAGAQSSVDDIAADPALSVTRAARQGRIIEVDGVSVLQFGPRTPAAIAELAQELQTMMLAAAATQ